MKEYSYYPGCSLESTAIAYGSSTEAVAKKLGLKFTELKDWNCCGATSYMSIDEKLAFALSARNLALAEPLGLDLVTPCSGCYTTLNKTNHYFHDYPIVHNMINDVLGKAGMQYNGKVKVRHLLDIFMTDAGSQIVPNVRKPLKGLNIACYYGCQIVRPKDGFDDPEYPTSLDTLMLMLGANPVNFQYKTRCCGGSLMGTKEELALRMSKNILLAAAANGAKAIVTTCPLCQINLDAFQDKVNRIYNTNFKLPIFYFTQLMGLAFDISGTELKLETGIVDTQPALAAIK